MLSTRRTTEDNDVIQGEEDYFEICRRSRAAVCGGWSEKDFDAYWNSGLKWPVVGDAPKTVEERLEEIEADNVTALEGIAELYEMLMQ